MNTSGRLETLDQGHHALWATPLSVFHWDEADSVQPLLVRVLQTLRLAQETQRGSDLAAPRSAFFASDDDLIQRVQLPEWQRLLRFIVHSVGEAAKQANAGAWPAQGLDLQVAIEGMWFQISRGGAFHDVHTHGNCSWSGVYCVQVDPPERRARHPAWGAHNGVTRFYGPRFERLGGAHMDAGNAYLQSAHVDVEPVPGQLVVFPAWLPHQAMPYDGDAERIIISFNASLHVRGGGDRLPGQAYAAR